MSLIFKPIPPRITSIRKLKHGESLIFTGDKTDVNKRLWRSLNEDPNFKYETKNMLLLDPETLIVQHVVAVKRLRKEK